MGPNYLFYFCRIFRFEGHKLTPWLWSCNLHTPPSAVLGWDDQRKPSNKQVNKRICITFIFSRSKNCLSELLFNCMLQFYFTLLPQPTV